MGFLYLLYYPVLAVNAKVQLENIQYTKHSNLKILYSPAER
jgi:hypothetical protein